MKSNKGIVTILTNLMEFVLQQRMNHSHQTVSHVATLSQELTLLKDQLLPSMEILHFLVDNSNYHLKHKITQQLKDIPLEALTLKVEFSLHDKASSSTHLAEVWTLQVEKTRSQEVPPESTAHELLFMLQQIIKQLSSGIFLNELIRNREATKKFIIDFHIKIAATDKYNQSMGESRVIQENGSKVHDKASPQTQLLSHVWLNHARLDNSR